MPDNPIRKRIVVVDDDTSYRAFIENLLEMEGFKPVGYANPKDALKNISRLYAIPSLIIVDFNMDGMNGFEFIREFRRRNGSHAITSTKPV